MVRIFAISFCFILIFATSGNSRGLIFKNLPKNYRIDKDLGEDPGGFVPPAEEIVEELKVKNYITEEISLDHYNPGIVQLVANHFFDGGSYEIPILDVATPPPDFII